MTRQKDRCNALPPDYCGCILNGTYSEKLKNRVVETIASHRPYRPALGIEKALEEISTNCSTLYDPHVVSETGNPVDKPFDF